MPPPPPPGQAPPPPAQVQAQAPAFALSPALAITGTIDYSTKYGAEIYKNAVAKLPCEPFDCKSADLKVYLQALRNCTSAHGWEHILEVPRVLANPAANLISLIDHYGEIELSHLRAHVNTYIRTHTRATQDKVQLIASLSASLSQDAMAKVTTWKSEFTIGNYQSGTLLLKVILRETHIDNRGTVLHIRDQISKLDTYIATISYDITKFNEHVMDLVKGLDARGARTEDLLANLFKAYRSVNDHNFVDYIKTKKDQYDEGQDVTPEGLMHQA